MVPVGQFSSPSAGQPRPELVCPRESRATLRGHQRLSEDETRLLVRAWNPTRQGQSPRVLLSSLGDCLGTTVKRTNSPAFLTVEQREGEIWNFKALNVSWFGHILQQDKIWL